jgi:hypothetical protein
MDTAHFSEIILPFYTRTLQYIEEICEEGIQMTDSCGVKSGKR